MKPYRTPWVSLLCLLALPIVGAAQAFAAHADKKGSDPALFSRMPNYYLSYDVKTVPFKSHTFRVADRPGNWKEQVVEGRYSEYVYAFDASSGAERPSGLQITRNYQNAASKAGGQVMAFDRRGNWTSLRFLKDGKATWAFVDAHDNGAEYKVFIVEEQEMKQDVNANADALALASGLANSGHVEVPGIYFDFAKADIKPESEPALKEVVKLLQVKPALKLWVVGHTDYVGGAESNIALSNARAAAVVKALSQRLGVDAKRLAPFGAGPYAPVASNKADDGRALNRRVELVERP
jgi:outer membrane protein OmpA-like peptidoglycan-associated protein